MARSRYAIALAVALLGALVVYVRLKIPALVLLVGNKDVNTLPETSAFKSREVVFKDQLRNCEHVVFDEDRSVAWLSCDPGRDRWNNVLGTHKDPQWRTGTIYYMDYESWGQGTPDKVQPLEFAWRDSAHQKQFHPLGFAVRGRSMFIANHDPDGPFIEHLELSEDGKSATHKQTIKHDLLHAPNSIMVLSNTELLITNDHYFPPHINKALNKMETFLTPPTGNVVQYDLASGRASVAAWLPYANGIALLNETCLAVASTSTPAVYIYNMDPADHKLTYAKKLTTPMFVDNLSVDKAGHLIAAGHPHPGPTDAIAAHRAIYSLDDKLPQGEERPRAGSFVVQWRGDDESTQQTLYSNSREYMSSASAARDSDRGFGFVTGLYDQGILFFRD